MHELTHVFNAVRPGSTAASPASAAALARSYRSASWLPVLLAIARIGALAMVGTHAQQAT